MVQNKLTKGFIMTITPETEVVLVFDTDVYNSSRVIESIGMLKNYGVAYKVITIPQVKNFEDELVFSTDVKTISELTNSRSNKDFKSDFIGLSDCRSVLKRHHFDINRLWSRNPTNGFSDVKQMSKEIKNN